MYNLKTKVWKGSEIDVPKTSFGEIIFEHLSQNANKLAQIFADDDSRIVFGEIKKNSIRFSLNLHQLGIRQGDVVCIMAANHKYTSAILIGSIFSGAPFHFVDLNYDKGM